MNIVVVVEGKGEIRLFKAWIPFVNPQITCVDQIEGISADNFAISSGMGYPYYWEVIDDAMERVDSHGNIDRVVISVDSEELTLQEKREEIYEHLAGKTCSAHISLAIRHFCIETWALGNRKACALNPAPGHLSTYKSFFDVRTCDPELLPAYPPRRLNRAQFAEVYLRAMLHYRNSHFTYRKGNPIALCHRGYFDEIRLRHETANHITSFGPFLQAFI